ncbi:MAG: hypothetical protein QNK16_12870 [Woeseiaceae bacterium]|nr:hypothetical protein [Woeseiaceae bacterium]MDX2609268.1 hypothetical protein [Woeseiaceae bacterium]
MPRLYLTVLLLGLTGCAVHAPDAAQDDPVRREQELAKSSIWHKAKLRGVAFRAIGQEPGWLLEIKNGEEILVVTNYGQNRNLYPYVDPQEDKAARKTVFQVDANTRVLIEGMPCSDSMSGETFQSTVTVTLGAQVLKGCGRALF